MKCTWPKCTQNASIRLKSYVLCGTHARQIEDYEGPEAQHLVELIVAKLVEEEVAKN